MSPNDRMWTVSAKTTLSCPMRPADLQAIGKNRTRHQMGGMARNFVSRETTSGDIVHAPGGGAKGEVERMGKLYKGSGPAAHLGLSIGAVSNGAATPSSQFGQRPFNRPVFVHYLRQVAGALTRDGMAPSKVKELSKTPRAHAPLDIGPWSHSWGLALELGHLKQFMYQH